MNWNGLDRIHDVHHLAEGDDDVVREVQEVLRRHGAEGRLGITLLHSHFDLDPDEILVERVDTNSRTLTITAERASSFEPDQLVPTAWRLDGSQRAAITYCWRPKDSVFHAR